MVLESDVQESWKYETYDAIVRAKLGRCIFSETAAKDQCRPREF